MHEAYELKNRSFSLTPSLSSNFTVLFDLLFYKSAGPWMFMFFPLFLFLSCSNISNSRKNHYILILLIIVNLSVWVFLQLWLLRYNLFFYVLMLIGSVIAIQHLDEKNAGIRFLVLGIAVILFINSFGYMVYRHKNAIYYAMAKTDEKKYLNKRKAIFGPAVLWMNKHLPKRARICTNIMPFYYSERTMILLHPTTEYGGFVTLETADLFHKRLKDLSIEYIAYKNWGDKTRSSFRSGKGLKTKAFMVKIREFIDELVKSRRLKLLHFVDGVSIYQLS